MDVVLLARLQFALTIGFHFLFPPISIGLAWMLVIIEWLGWKREDPEYQKLGHFFGRILGLTFAVGVATGIVMEFQFGTNWAQYSRFVGDIFGAPLAAEAVFAFFLESGFLGLYLFGRKRISKGTYWFSILMVAFGATLSAFWILVANSWQQTPAGYILRNGRAELTNFWEAVFNPSTVIRFFHTVDAAVIVGAFFVAGISAYLILYKKNNYAMKTMKIALIVGLIASLLELFPFGHEHAKQVAKYQPEKFATFEGIMETETHAPLLIFGIPAGQGKEPVSTIKIPGVLSWLLYGDSSAEVKGLNEFKKSEIPPTAITFVSFHLMVALGFYFIVVMLLGVIWLFRKSLKNKIWFHKLLLWSIPLPILTCQFGWITTEVGRQPWIVYHMLKTSDAVSKVVPAGNILFSIFMFTAIYVVLGVLYIYLLARKVKAGPTLQTAEEV